MRVIDQTPATTVASDDKVLIDGSLGARAVDIEDFVKAMNERFGWMSLYGDKLPVEARRSIFRGKKLGTGVSEDQYAAIASGDFTDMFVGDYWGIEDRIWRIVDIDYWMGSGTPPCTSHHLVIMPDKSLYKHQMNSTRTSDGGYSGSDLRTTGLEEAKTIINSAFGTDHILNHKEYLSNAVTDGYESGGATFDSTVEIPSEIMVYGCHMFSPGGDGTINISRFTYDSSQLSCFRLSPHLRCVKGENYWLRDVVSTKSFACVYGDGMVNYYYADSLVAMVRPVFGIKG